MNGHAGSSAKFRWKWLVFLIVLAAGGVAVWKWRANALLPPQLRTVAVEQRDLQITVTATGSLEPEEIVEVGASVTGKLVQFGADLDAPRNWIDVGSRVENGTVLARIDNVLYQVAMQKAAAALRLAEAEMGRLNVRLQQANRDLERAKQLRTTNSQSEFDRVVTAYDSVQAELQIGQARLEQARAESQGAEINLQRTVMRSPIDGVVIDRRANLGQNAGPGAGSGLFLVAKDLSRMRIRATVSEADIGKIQVGQPVTFTVDAYREQEFAGRVEKILLNARIHQNVVNYDVLVTFDNTGTELMPNMTANLQFEVVKRENVKLVPSEALQWWPGKDRIVSSAAELIRPKTGEVERFKEGDTAVIWQPAEEGKVRPLHVRLGIDDGIHTEIASEQLAEGTPIVVGTVNQANLARIIPKTRTR